MIDYSKLGKSGTEAFKPLVNGADDLIYALKGSSLPDSNDFDKLHRAKKAKAKKGTDQADNESQAQGYLEFDNKGKVEKKTPSPSEQPSPALSAQPMEPGAVFKAVDPEVNLVGKAATGVFMGTAAAEMLAPAMGKVAGWFSFEGLKKTLNRPSKYLNETHVDAAKKRTTGSALNDGAFIAMGAASTYAVARSFSAQGIAYRNAVEDITGMSTAGISLMDLLSKKGPPILEDARQHLLKEHAARFAVQGTGLAYVISRIAKAKSIPFLAMMAPMFADMGVDALLGESVLPTYTAFSQAYKKGEMLPPDAYKTLLFATSKELKARGRVGEQVALEVAKQYATEKASPGAVLKEVNEGANGKFMARVHAVLAAAESKKAAAAPALKTTSTAPLVHAKDAPMPINSVVDTLNGRKPREAVGKFSKQIIDKDQSIVPSIT